MNTLERARCVAIVEIFYRACSRRGIPLHSCVIPRQSEASRVSEKTPRLVNTGVVTPATPLFSGAQSPVVMNVIRRLQGQKTIAHLDGDGVKTS